MTEFLSQRMFGCPEWQTNTKTDLIHQSLQQCAWQNLLPPTEWCMGDRKKAVELYHFKMKWGLFRSEPTESLLSSDMPDFLRRNLKKILWNIAQTLPALPF